MSSRYDLVEIATLTVPDADGGTRNVRHHRRRWTPPESNQPPLARHRVAPNDRLDLVSARYLGVATMWWRICDANEALDPDGLVDATAEDNILIVPVPGV